MYIDQYKVEIKGSQYDEKTNKKLKDKLLATYESNQGMPIKNLISILSELADSHNANYNINFNIVMKQYEDD